MITVSAGGSLTGVNVMSGDAERAEGWKVAASSPGKEQISVPSVLPKYSASQYVDKIIKDEKCDMVGMGRNSPEREWVKMLLQERDELRYCIILHELLGIMDSFRTSQDAA